MSQPQFGTTTTQYPQAGELLDGKYRIEKPLGEGGMGAVAKATHLLRKAPVALKFMSPAILAMPGAVERFVNEGVAVSQIDSDHVVKVFDVGRLPNGAPYLVMEFLEGCDLSQLLERQGGPIEVPRAIHFTLQMLRALQTAHAAGIVHRDMKPSNCFVTTKDGELDFVKLVDFGISKVRSDDPEVHGAQLTRTNSALGTPLYMSPEQARSPRDVDVRTDLYSVGAILYEMLTRRTPYSADSGEYTEILFKIFTTDPDRLGALRPDLPERLCAAVDRALLRVREARFGSALEMADELSAFADDRSAEVLSKLRAGRSRRVRPSATPSPPSATPSPSARPSPYPGITGPGMGGSTDLGMAGEALRAPRLPTDIGVVREPREDGPSAASTSGRMVLFFAVAGILALLCAVAGIVVVRWHRPAGTEVAPAKAPAGLAPTALPALPAESPPPSAAPSALAAPFSSSSASVANATPTEATASAVGSAGASSSRPALRQPSLPQTLGELKLH
jgi:serine/threonine protein kinase